MARGSTGFPGMGGGMGNMQQLMKQAQRMQQQMLEAQEKLEAEEYTAQAGGGMVSATVNGKKEIVALTINPECVDPDDVEMLQDLVMSAVNEALRAAVQAANESLGKFTGGRNIGF